MMNFERSLHAGSPDPTNAQVGPDVPPVSVFEHAPVGIFVVRDQRLTYMNRRLAEWFGDSPEDLLAHDALLPLVAGTDAELAVEGAPRGPDGAPPHSEYQAAGTRKDGTPIELLVGSHVTAYNGRPTVVATLIDQTELRRAEAANRELRAHLAHLSRVVSMGHLAAGLAHELNQPLTAIVNYAGACATVLNSREPPPLDKLRDAMHKIAGNAQRAGEIIRLLKQFVRKSPPQRASADVGDLIRDVVEMVATEARDQGVALLWKPAGRPLVADVDPIQIQQVLVNLLQNAIDAVKDQPPQRRNITVVADTAGAGQLEVAVVDQGTGVPKADVERIFDYFVTSKPSGLGMGLPISRAIVEDHGGTLRLEGNPVHGATFRFSLPVR